MWKTLLAVLFSVAGGVGSSPGGEKPGSGDLPEWMSGVIRIERDKDEAAYDAFAAGHRIIEDRVTAKTRASFLEAKFPKTMAECAIAAEEVPRVIDGHPRILVRRDPWAGGLSLGELRQRARQEPWAGAFRRMGAAFKRTVERQTPLRFSEARDAALYYLVTGDESVVPAVVQAIMSRTNAGYGMGGLPFIAYDWIHNSKSLTPETRKSLTAHLVKLAHSAVALQDGANCHDIWRHRGGGAVDPVVAGLVLYGEVPEGERLLRTAIGYYKRAFLPAYQHTGGGWLGGGHSYDGAVWGLPLALACWDSATEDHVFEMIKRDYDNWLERHMYFWMHQVFPDRTRSESIGTNYDPWKLIINTDAFLLISRAYENPDGYAFLRWLGERYEPKLPRDLHVLLYDPELEKKTPSAVFSRPWSHLWGRDLLGYAQMRSRGWQPDSAVIEFKAGDYTELHGHYSNQNAFSIYHKGRLAIQGGTYAAGSGVWSGGDHAMHYYRRTVSSNSLLVFQPGEFHWTGGRRGFIPNAGQWADVFGYRSLTFDEYRWRVKNDPRYDMGTITAFEHAPDFTYTYVCGDATNAYNSPRYCTWAEPERGVIVVNRPKIDLFTRSLVYLSPQNLVVFDRVNALEASWRKAWLLQSIGRPAVSGRLINAPVPGHIEDFDGDTVTVTWPGGVCKPPDPDDPGRLIVRTFLPTERVIRRIGGRDYEFYANGGNHPLSGKGMKYVKGGVLSWVWDEARGEGQDMANWRVEISPGRAAKFDNFLHLIHICDTRTEQLPPAAMVTDDGRKMVGLAVGGWLVMFGARGRVAGDIGYQAPRGRTEHLLVDLTPGVQYRIAGIADGERTMTASKEGTLRFATGGRGIVTLTPRRT